MPLLEYWSCPNGHIVLRQYMPQSGTICNVYMPQLEQHCKGERRKHLAEVSEEAKAADEFVSVITLNEDAPINWVHLMALAEKKIEEEIEDGYAVR